MNELGMFTKMRIFQKTAAGILILFLGILVFVTIIAHSRQSGTTHQDMSKAQLIRRDTALK